MFFSRCSSPLLHSQGFLVFTFQTQLQQEDV